MRAISLFCATLFTVFSSSAALYQLTNTAPSVDINVAGNWSGGVVPGANDDVEIINDGPQTLTFSGGSSLTWNSLRLFGTNNVVKSFDIGEGRSLTILNGVRLANEASATNRMQWNTGCLFITNDSRTSTLTIGHSEPGDATLNGSGRLAWGTWQSWTVVVDRVDVRTNPPPNGAALNLQGASAIGLFEVRNGGTNYSDNEAFDAMFKLSGGFWRLHNGYANTYTEMMLGRGGIWLDGPTTYFRNDRQNGSFRAANNASALVIITNRATLEAATTSAGRIWNIGDVNSKDARMFIVDNGVLTTRMNSFAMNAVTSGQKAGTNLLYLGKGGKIYATHGWVGRATGNNAANTIAFNNTCTITDLGTEWRCRDSFYFGWSDCTGASVNIHFDTNTLTIANGALVMATGVFSVGFVAPNAVASFSEHNALLDGGTIIVTSRYNTGTFEVRNGHFTMKDGTLLCDRFIVTNAPAGVFEFGGGSVHAKQSMTLGSGVALTNYGVMTVGAALTLEAGGLLAGTGAVNGAVVVAGGATLSPGLSPGVLPINGDLTMNAGSTYVWEKDAGAYNVDRIDVSGNLDIAGVTTVQVIRLNGAAPGGPTETNVLFQVGGTLSGFTNLVLDLQDESGWIGALYEDGQNVQLLLTPEPGVAAMGALALLLLRRRS